MSQADSLDSQESTVAGGARHGALLAEDHQWMHQHFHWSLKRHLTHGNPRPRDHRDLPDWRMRERLRTVTAALVMCLNIGVDPPDVSKTNPCSKLICWMDPTSLEVSKALPAIGRNLQAQFETLSTKTRYKQYLDPIVEETRRFCTTLRRAAKDERVLFYYNGYGVPKPTPGGEIWVFNKAYTQYIPVTLYDLLTWLGSPCIFVWDASSAGNVLLNFQRLQERKGDGPAAAASATDPMSFPLRESIHLAACGPDEVLPMNPDLPADLFTCCLTSPIEISLRWFVLQNPLPSKLNVDMVMNIPGRLQDRRTPLGELNWIFTAITDTIAWTVLPRTIFRRLFRDDLMVAALLRNFLLAERIMRFYHCTPMSHPKLPATHNHPLWDSWDLAVDQCLAQLPTLLAKEQATQAGGPIPLHLASFEYRHSSFFSEQLKAFEVWLQQGGVSRKGRRRRVNSASDHAVLDPPDQLPIVLQVLLSQVHRLRALILLSQFLDLGPWAVNLALSIGIFPYVLKLLQSPAADLKPVLIYIWARILAVDRSCQNDLLRDNGFVYFAGVLSPFQNVGQPTGGPIPNVSEHRAMCAFILAVFCQDFPAGQTACLETDVMHSCVEHLEDDDFLLRQWSALCLAQLWSHNEPAKAKAIALDAHGKLCCMLSDVSPEVRAAVLYSLGTLLGGSAIGLPGAKQRGLEVGIAIAMLTTRGDCSPLVRKELVIALSALVAEYRGFFVLAAYLYNHKNAGRATEEVLARLCSKLLIDGEFEEDDIANIPAFSVVFVALLDLSADSDPEVANLGCTVVDFVIALLLESNLASMGDVSARFTTPTCTDASLEGYFPLSTSARTATTPDEVASTARTSTLPRRHPPKRSSTLAQAVKSFTSLGYSRPPSPVSDQDQNGDAAPTGVPPPGPAMHVATSVPLSGSTTPIMESSGSSTPNHPNNSSPGGHYNTTPAQYNSPYPASSAGRSTGLDPLVDDHVKVGDTLAALITMDLYRFTARGSAEGSRATTPASSPAVSRANRWGITAGSSAGSTTMGAELRETLPLRSGLFAWCSEYYTEPQMKPTESEEPGSIKYNVQHWKTQRNSMVIERGGHASSERAWKENAGYIRNGGAARVLLFHQFESHLVTASDQDTVAVWDWEQKRLLSRFGNGNPAGTRISSAAFVNEDSDGLLLVGSSEGNVRIYREYAADVSPDGVQLASSFMAVPDLVRSKRPSGLIAEWVQGSGQLLAGGDSRVIRVWDAHRELCVYDIPTRASSCVTSMSSDVGHLFVAGFGDGTVGVYDRRNPPEASLVRLWEEHQTWIQNVHLQKRGDRELVSGSLDGQVRLWDMRARESIDLLDLGLSGLDCMAVHEALPIVAAGGSLTSLTGQRLGWYGAGMSSIAFHGQLGLFASCGMDGVIELRR